MVFQSYALYPHMSVYRNLTFGPRVRGEDRAETHRRVLDVAGVLGLEKLLDRRPGELSGGQRQRVALGRALLRQPKLFLMDEPLSNLDAALRGQVRAELIRLHQQLGVTTVYVTHDQTEAMAMADRIAVMFEGRLQQAGTPEEIFDDPVNLMVASFIGAPRMNLVAGSLTVHGERLAVELLGVELLLPPEVRLMPGHDLPKPVTVGLRPTDLALRSLCSNGAAPEGAAPLLRGSIDIVEPMGAETYLTVSCTGQSLSCRAPGRERLAIGEEIGLAVDERFLYAFDTETGAAIIDRAGWRQSASPRRGVPAD
jgi:multiple sugar transport system ATP-binding protein